MRIYLTNLGKYNEGELVGQWLELPCTKAELDATLKAIYIGGNYEEYFITDDENDLGLEIGEYENLTELNDMARLVSCLDTYELQTLQAIIELESPGVSNIATIVKRLDEYTLHTDISDDKELGYYLIHEVGGYDLECMGDLANYLDYEAYGRDMRINASGGFTSKGWLEHQE